MVPRTMVYQSFMVPITMVYLITGGVKTIYLINHLIFNRKIYGFLSNFP